MDYFFEILFPIIFIGIFIFVFVTIIISFFQISKVQSKAFKHVNDTFDKVYNNSSNQNSYNKNTRVNNGQENSHFSQAAYSYSYSKSNKSSDNGKFEIKDRPLSETEINTLYGNNNR